MSTNAEKDSSSPEAALPGTAAVNSSLLEGLTISPTSVAADQEAVVALRGLSVESTEPINTGTSDVGLSDSESTSTSVTAPDESDKPVSGGFGRPPMFSGSPLGATTGTTATTTSASLFGTDTGVFGSAGPYSFDAFSAPNEASAVTTPSDNAGQQSSFGQTGSESVWSGGSVFCQNTQVRRPLSFGQSPPTTNSSVGRERHSGHHEKGASADKTYPDMFGGVTFGTSDDTRNSSLFGEGGPTTFDTVSSKFSPFFNKYTTTPPSSDSGQQQRCEHLWGQSSHDIIPVNVFGGGTFETSDKTQNSSLFGKDGPTIFDTVSRDGVVIPGRFSDGRDRSVGFDISKATQIQKGTEGFGAQPSFAWSPSLVKPSSGGTTEFGTPPSGTGTFGNIAQHGQPSFGEKAQDGDGNDGQVGGVFSTQPVFSNQQAGLGYRHSSAATKDYEG